MSRRPLSLTLIGWLFVAMGVGEIVSGLVRSGGHLGRDEAWVLSLGVVSLSGGVLTLRGSNFGRWLILAWLVFHVVISGFHDPFRLITHVLLLVILGYFLLRPRASAYFRGAAP